VREKEGRREGKNNMRECEEKISINSSHLFNSNSHHKIHTKAYVKYDINTLREILGDKIFSQIKNDEKLKENSKKFLLEWEGDVKSVKVHSLVYIPVNEISVELLC
jgi:hypothetical protein